MLISATGAGRLVHDGGDAAKLVDEAKADIQGVHAWLQQYIGGVALPDDWSEALALTRKLAERVFG